jgi:hypothetical protein
MEQYLVFDQAYRLGLIEGHLSLRSQRHCIELFAQYGDPLPKKCLVSHFQKIIESLVGFVNNSHREPSIQDGYHSIDSSIYC